MRHLNKKQKTELKKLATDYFKVMHRSLLINDLSIDYRNRVAGWNDHETVFDNMDRYLSDIGYELSINSD